MTRRRSSMDRAPKRRENASSTLAAGSSDWVDIVPDIYREPKTIPHRTWNGRGVVGRLRRR